MSKIETRNLHVPLPDPIYARLRIEAQRSKRPATDLAREAIYNWLSEKQRLYVHESVAEYARKNAGTSIDLDEQLEALGIENMFSIDPVTDHQASK